MNGISIGLHIHTDAKEALKSMHFIIWYFWPEFEIIIEIENI